MNTIRAGAASGAPAFSLSPLKTEDVFVMAKLVGKIGVIGPTRMKYDEITSIMEYLTNNLSESFRLPDSTGDGNAGNEKQKK
jgi:heat-inducible transcriptional repressor